MKNYHLGFVGCGNMASAIIKALLNSNQKQRLLQEGISLQISAYDLDVQKVIDLQEYGVQNFLDSQTMIDACDMVVLAIKPQNAPEILSCLNVTNKIVLSIMAGVSLLQLGEMSKAQKIVRVMPNLNARVGSSYNAYCSNGLSSEEQNLVHSLLQSFGSASKVSESQMNAVTGLTGSAPAFVFTFIKALTDEGVAQGFSYEVALDMALCTVIGSAKTVQNDSNADLPHLISSVCSKGGTTIEGIKYLKECNMEETVRGAVVKAIDRAKEMEKNS